MSVGILIFFHFNFHLFHFFSSKLLLFISSKFQAKKLYLRIQLSSKFETIVKFNCGGSILFIHILQHSLEKAKYTIYFIHLCVALSTILQHSDVLLSSNCYYNVEFKRYPDSHCFFPFTIVCFGH